MIYEDTLQLQQRKREKEKERKEWCLNDSLSQLSIRLLTLALDMISGILRLSSDLGMEPALRSLSASPSDLPQLALSCACSLS